MTDHEEEITQENLLKDITSTVISGIKENRDNVNERKSLLRRFIKTVKARISDSNQKFQGADYKAVIDSVKDQSCKYILMLDSPSDASSAEDSKLDYEQIPKPNIKSYPKLSPDAAKHIDLAFHHRDKAMHADRQVLENLKAAAEIDKYEHIQPYLEFFARSPFNVSATFTAPVPSYVEEAFQSEVKKRTDTRQGLSDLAKVHKNIREQHFPRYSELKNKDEITRTVAAMAYLLLEWELINPKASQKDIALMFKIKPANFSKAKSGIKYDGGSSKPSTKRKRDSDDDDDDKDGKRASKPKAKKSKTASATVTKSSSKSDQTPQDSGQTSQDKTADQAGEEIISIDNIGDDILAGLSPDPQLSASKSPRSAPVCSGKSSNPPGPCMSPKVSLKPVGKSSSASTDDVSVRSGPQPNTKSPKPKSSSSSSSSEEETKHVIGSAIIKKNLSDSSDKDKSSSEETQKTKRQRKTPSIQSLAKPAAGKKKPKPKKPKVKRTTRLETSSETLDTN